MDLSSTSVRAISTCAIALAVAILAEPSQARRYSAVGPASTIAASGSNIVTAMNDDGEFVVAWYEGYEHRARVFHADGSPRGDSFRVTQAPSLPPFDHAIAMDPHNGVFVVVWRREGSPASVDPDTRRASIQASVFTMDGVLVSGDLQVNNEALIGGLEPDVAIDRDGYFVVVWESAGTIEARRFRTRAPQWLAVSPIEEQFTVAAGSRPSVAMRHREEFVVAWDESIRSIGARAFMPASGIYPVASEGGGFLMRPEVLTHPYVGSYFAIRWLDSNEGGYMLQAFGLYDPLPSVPPNQLELIPLGAAFHVSPILAMDDEGSIGSIDLHADQLYFQLYPPNATAPTQTFPIGVPTPGGHWLDIASGGAGRFVVAWSNATGVHVQRIPEPAAWPSAGGAVFALSAVAAGARHAERRCGVSVGRSCRGTPTLAH